MRKQSSRRFERVRRGLPLGGSVLRIVAASAIAGMTLAQIKDKPEVKESRSGEAPSSTAAAREADQGLWKLCSSLPGGRLPEGSNLARDKQGGSLRELKGDNLSRILEENQAFRTLQQTARNGEIALCFIQAYRALFKLESPWDELREVSSIPDDQGATHVRLRQYYKDMVVHKGEISIHLNPEKQVYWVEGSYYPTPVGLATKPHVSPDFATAAARDTLGWDKSVQRTFRTQATIYVDAGKRARLAYQITASGHQVEDWEIWVDAGTGAILQKFPLKKSRP